MFPFLLYVHVHNRTTKSCSSCNCKTVKINIVHRTYFVQTNFTLPHVNIPVEEEGDALAMLTVYWDHDDDDDHDHHPPPPFCLVSKHYCLGLQEVTCKPITHPFLFRLTF